jgi:ArsR family transcriptional regulator
MNPEEAPPKKEVDRAGDGMYRYIRIYGLIVNTVLHRPEIFDRLAALGEPTRTRVLLLLEGRELTVSELCTVLQAPQSTVSRHLKALADAGWIGSRPEGTSRFYGMDREALSDSMRRMWLAVRDELDAAPGAEQDRARLAPVLAQRRSRSEEFFRSEAGQWDRTRDELFGHGFYLLGLPGLLDPAWVVGDLGCGTGHVTESLAPFVSRVVAVDGSEAMLVEARRCLAGRDNVDLRHGELEALPIEDAALDAAVLALVLHHVPDPGRVLREVSRTVRPGGRVLVVDMLPHDRADLAATMGHVWLGFSEEAIGRHLGDSGFEETRFVRLPVDPAAKGPALFAAAAERATAGPESSTMERSKQKRPRREVR